MAVFYQPGASRSAIFEASARRVAILNDTVDFPDQKGGEVTRELGIPYLAAADAVDVTAASIQFETSLLEQDIAFTAAASSDGKGIVVTLPRQMYLRSVEISYTDPAAPAPPQALRLMIRGTAGKVPPPLLASPAFPPAGEMYPAPMEGLSVIGLSNGHKLLKCAGLLGTSWLIQVAAASTAVDISAMAIVPAVHAVTAQVAPMNLRVQMETTAGDVKLWANPGVLLPVAGVQTVSMLALGKRQLQAELAQTAPGPAPATLPLRIKFQCDSAGSLIIDKAQLEARYQVLAAGAKPAPLTIGGDWTDWPLTAPPRLAPESTSIGLRVQLNGRELNSGSPQPPVADPAAGLDLGTDRWLAVSLPFLPLKGQPNGSVLPLASVRLYLAADAATETALEIRNDAAGNPGPPAAPPIVHRLKEGDHGWIEFVPSKQIPVSTGKSPLWLVLRVTKGQVHWYAGPPRDGVAVLAERASTDAGKTWAAPPRPMGADGSLLAQLFHALQDPLPPPSLTLYRRGSETPLAELFAGATRQGAREFTVSQVALPADAGKDFAAAAGSGKVTLPFRLFSPSAGTVTVQEAVFVYDPDQVPAAGGGA